MELCRLFFLTMTMKLPARPRFSATAMNRPLQKHGAGRTVAGSWFGAATAWSAYLKTSVISLAMTA